MARKPMVTRTIQSTKVVVLCLDTEKCEPYNEVVEISRTYKDDKTLFKKVAEVIDTDNHKAVKIVSSEVIDGVYGMTETDFLKYAHKLDPATRKMLEEDTDYCNDSDEVDEDQQSIGWVVGKSTQITLVTLTKLTKISSQ